MISKIAKLVIQSLSAILGLIGSVLLYSSVTLFIQGIKEGALFILFSILFLFIGLLLVATAYSGLFRFSAKSISYVTCILGFLAYTESSDFLRSLIENVVFENYGMELITVISPIAIGVLCHKFLKWAFTKLIYKDIQPAHGPYGKNAG